MGLRASLSIVLFCVSATGVTASDRTATVPVRATFGERTSLSVSASVLRFVVAPGATTATANLEFTAGVRTLPGREVLVLVEPLRQFHEVLIFSGAGEGVLSGELIGGAPAIVARYIGGGQRHGQIVFTLEDAAPGIYTVPVSLFITVL